MEPNKTIDFLAIGDIVIDAFITLKDAEVHCGLDHENCMLSMRFGDKIPYESVKVVKAVGNAPNAATSAARLGLSSAVMTHVGDDDFGIECIETLTDNGVGTQFVTTEPGKTTNYHYVLSFQAERTILIKHEEYSYDWNRQIGDTIPRWVYFSSVGEKSIPYHHDIVTWVKENGVKMAFQPGTFQINLGPEKLADVYQATELFFCNVEESQRILRTDIRNLKILLKSIADLGPKIVCITDGSDGAYAYDSYNDEYWFHPVYPDPQKPIERTGAGDAFASTFTTALVKGKSVAEAMSWGPINSMNVVQHIGAQEGLLSEEQLLVNLAQGPQDYHAQAI